MKYFAEYITTETVAGSFREVINVYMQDNPPIPSSSDSIIREITDGTYFNYRETLETSVGRCLADIIKNDTFHKYPYEGTKTLYERYLDVANKEGGTL